MRAAPLCRAVWPGRRRALLLVSLLALAPGGCRAGGPGPAKVPVVAVAPARIAGIPNYVRVSEALARGGMPTDPGFRELRKSGVRTVISLRTFDSDRKHLAGSGMKYEHISFKHVHPEEEDVLRFLRIVTDPRNQPVFVHCLEGVDRTGMMVAAYRMVVQGWPKDRALDEMFDMGFHRIHWAIRRYLDRLDVDALKRKLSEESGPGNRSPE